MRSSTLILTLLASACSAGASAPSTSVVPLESGDPLATNRWRPPASDQACTIIPADVRTVAELVDSAALAAFVLTEAQLRDGSALWTVVFDAAGAPLHLRALEYSMEVPAVRAIQEELWRLLRPRSGPARARIRLDIATVDPASSPLLRLRIGGIQQCAPRLRNIEAVRRALGAVRRRGVVEVELVVGPDGDVIHREILSSSGDETTDRMGVGFVSGLRWDPGYVERIAVPSRVVYEVIFR